MSKLLKTNFYKLFHSKVYWIFFLLMPLMNLYSAVFSDSDYKLHIHSEKMPFWDGWNLSYTWTYLGHIWYLTYVVMIVIGLYIGDEISSGAIRNKIIAGHSRTKLYFSYFITSYVGMLMMHIFSEAVSLGFCLIRYGTGFYDKYEENLVIYKEVFPNDTSGDIPLSEFMSSQLKDMLNYNIAAVVALTAFVGLVLICMIAVGRKGPGFIAALLTDIALCTISSDKLSDLTLYFSDIKRFNDPEGFELFKKALRGLSFDPNGLIQSLSYQLEDLGAKYNCSDIFLQCVGCCLITAIVLTAAGLIVTNKRDLK